jgi:peptidoglycan hydrolase-like protein with peptidoglycan-binding domain
MLMQGSVPVFRDLRPGESGVDVRQLQEDLLALGFDPKETDGTFGPGTKAAVVAWYRSLGYEPAETSTDASTNLEAAEQRVRAASQAVDNAKAALKRAGKPVPPSTALSLDARVLDAQVALDSVTSAGTASVAHAAADRKAAAERLAALQQQVPSDPAAISRAASDLSAADSALSGAQTDAANKISSAKRGLEIAVAARTEGLSPPDLSDQELAVSSAEETLASEQASFDRLNRTTGPMVPSAEIVFVPTTPVVVDSLVATVGEKGTGDWIRLATSSLVVSTTLTRANRTLLPIGSKVVVDDEASATSFSGVLTAIADDASTSSTGETGYVATIAPDTPIAPSLSGQNFRVTITARQTNTKVLVVPLSAVFSRADGSEVVSKVVGTKQVDVRVVPGLSAGGYVAINPVQPQELTAGDQVVVAERAA